MLMVAPNHSGHRVAKLRITDVDLYAWIAQAEAGSWLEYHRGFLGIDVTPVISRLSETERRQLAELGQATLSAFEKGLVHLVQERTGPDQFAAIAVARPKPKAVAVSLSALLLADTRPRTAFQSLFTDHGDPYMPFPANTPPSTICRPSAPPRSQPCRSNCWQS